MDSKILPICTPTNRGGMSNKRLSIDLQRYNAMFLQCCSPQGKSMSLRILEDQLTSPSPCPWTTKSLKIFKDFAFCKLPVMYDHVTSINSVTVTVQDTVKNALLTDVSITYWYMSASKPFFTVTQCCCARGKSLSSRTNLQVLVLVLELQVLESNVVFVLESFAGDDDPDLWLFCLF